MTSKAFDKYLQDLDTCQYREASTWLAEQSITVFRSKEQNHIEKQYLAKLFLPSKPLRLDFEKHETKPLIAAVEAAEGISNELWSCETILRAAIRVIDTRDIRQWVSIDKQLTSGGTIKREVSKRLRRPISQAYLKLTEILNAVPTLIPKKSGVFNSFHLCEAPGNFIIALDHYLRHFTKYDDRTWNWTAQTLNPKHHANRTRIKTKEVLPDSFGLIRRFPNKWVWGADRSGDIKKLNLTFSYEDDTIDADLITSDCGTCISDNDYVFHEEALADLNLAQIFFILRHTPRGANAVFKTFLPMSKFCTLSSMYVLYSSFEKMSIVKPTLNPTSSEVYVVLQKFQGCGEDVFKAFHEWVETCDVDKGIVKESCIDDRFLLQYEKIISAFCEKTVQSLQSVTFFVDHSDLSPNVLRSIHEEQSRYQSIWCRTHGF